MPKITSFIPASGGWSCLYASQKLQHRPVKRLRLIDVRRVSSIRDDDFLRTGNLVGHVVGRRQERLVFRTGEDEGGNLNRFQRSNDTGVALRQHAAGRVR